MIIAIHVAAYVQASVTTSAVMSALTSTLTLAYVDMRSLMSIVIGIGMSTAAMLVAKTVMIGARTTLAVMVTLTMIMNSRRNHVVIAVPSDTTLIDINIDRSVVEGRGGVNMMLNMVVNMVANMMVIGTATDIVALNL